MIQIDIAAQAKVQQQVTSWVTLLARVVWPALATLVPAGVTALFKVAQNRSRSRRSVALTDRITQLSKSIAELPETATTPGSSITPRVVLTAELNLAVNELTALQNRVRYNFREASNTATTKLRAALLLFRPKGLPATMLHALFFAYNSVFLLFLFIMISSGDIPSPSSSDYVTTLITCTALTAIFSIPPLVLHHYAIKIRRRQTQASKDGAAHPPATQVATPIPVSQ